MHNTDGQILDAFAAQQVLDYELEKMKHPKTAVEIQSMSTRAYLDHTVIPILLDAMAVVAKERCVPLLYDGVISSSCLFIGLRIPSNTSPPIF